MADGIAAPLLRFPAPVVCCDPNNCRGSPRCRYRGAATEDRPACSWPIPSSSCSRSVRLFVHLSNSWCGGSSARAHEGIVADHRKVTGPTQNMCRARPSCELVYRYSSYRLPASLPSVTVSRPFLSPRSHYDSERHGPKKPICERTTPQAQAQPCSTVSWWLRGRLGGVRSRPTGSSRCGPARDAHSHGDERSHPNESPEPHANPRPGRNPCGSHSYSNRRCRSDKARPHEPRFLT